MIDDIASRLLGSKKYKLICTDTVYRISREAAARHKKPKDAEKAARQALHAITGAFLSADELGRLREYMAAGDIDAALSMHASTRERMPLDAFYGALFERTGRPRNVLDIACGLNPYYLGLKGIAVTGLDINAGLMEIINGWARGACADVTALAHDVLCNAPLPDGDYDMALMMKLLPLLETQRKNSAQALLRRVSAELMVVTFPTRTLSGRKIGMEAHYSKWFEGILTDEFILKDRYVINDELIYIIKRRG